MPRIRDVFYTNLDINNGKAKYFGLEFKDFVKSLSKDINNILLIKHRYSSENYNINTGFDYVLGREIENLQNADIYKYGDFCWVDFEHENALDSVLPQDIARLLYFAHKGHVLDSPFIDILNNRFAYYSHDDGWSNVLYFKYAEDFSSIISNYIVSKAKTSRRKDINPIQNKIISNLLNLSEFGLLIDFDNIVRTASIEIPLYNIGKIELMDDMYHNIDLFKEKKEKCKWLVYNNNEWDIVEY